VILDSPVTGRRKFAADRAFYQGDSCDGPLVDRLLAEHPGYRHSCAALILVADSVADTIRYYRMNAAKSLEFVVHLLRNGCRRLIFNSSARSMGREGLTFDEG
jgi:UDP-glucose 4-epimerase